MLKMFSCVGDSAGVCFLALLCNLSHRLLAHNSSASPPLWSLALPASKRVDCCMASNFLLRVPQIHLLFFFLITDELP